MKLTNVAYNAEKWTGHTEKVDRIVLLAVLLAGALGFAIVAYVVL
ncbi:hypothetical protein [Microbaculum marinisediminis]|nr:hypothetical protein [Microbaculum sp. A6E488]